MQLNLVSGFLLQFQFARKGTIQGVVTDAETNETIPFFNVYIPDKSVGATSDVEGNYKLDLEADIYEIIFSSLEYDKTSKTVTVEAGKTITLMS